MVLVVVVCIGMAFKCKHTRYLDGLLGVDFFELKRVTCMNVLYCNIYIPTHIKYLVFPDFIPTYLAIK